VRKLATLLIALSVSSSALAATPSEGVPLEVRRGFFTETSLGGGFTLGGTVAENYPGYSNFQIFLQLGLGYQFTINDGQGLIPVGFQLGIGSNAQSCFSTVSAAGLCAQSDNFTMIFTNVSAGYLHRLGTGSFSRRLYAGGKLMGGPAFVDPDPVGDGALVRPNIGVAASLEWATMMDHFSIGFDAAYRLIIGPNISALFFYLRVQYTF
jgi:hypothetical protein